MSKYNVGDIVKIVWPQRHIDHDLMLLRTPYIGQTATILKVNPIYQGRVYYEIDIGRHNASWFEDWLEFASPPCNCTLDITLL